MYQGRTVFSQLLDFMPRSIFHRCVTRYSGDKRTRSFTCLDQFICMAFAQLTFRDSLRDIVACLQALPEKLYHVGIRGRVSKSTLADANEKRDWRIYADFAQVLIKQARRLYTEEDFGLALKETVYALDATTIDLCLQLFPWAHFRRAKGGIKMHTLLDLRGNIPSFIAVTHALVHEVRVLGNLIPEPGAIYLLDRGYLDMKRLYRLHQHGAFFVVRAKSNTKFRRLYSHPVDKESGLRCDQIVVPKSFYPARDYPEKLRRIKFVDQEKQKTFVFLTNQFLLPAFTITELYRCRWQIELFFKWIKQHLRIKSFYGTTENAVKVQIWIAISVYVLVAIMKKQLHIDLRLYNILQILSVTLFEKIPILQALNAAAYKNQKGVLANQLNLFNS
ncbi:MAG: IS4 family transposase [Alphaproteobacteria bacterium]